MRTACVAGRGFRDDVVAEVRRRATGCVLGMGTGFCGAGRRIANFQKRSNGNGKGLDGYWAADRRQKRSGSLRGTWIE